MTISESGPPAGEGWPLPAAMVERAARFAAEGGQPPVPRVAATVVLLRSARGGPGFEVYAIKRAATMVFGGVYAFPGGGVDESDRAGRPDPTGRPLGWWARRLRLPADSARAVVCAALREVTEETGVVLGGDLLVPWSRWITPEFEPRRFDTYFFLARLPDGQAVLDVSAEADHGMWVTPAEALRRQATGEVTMLPPTAVTMRELAAHGDMASLLAAADAREPGVPVQPRLVRDPAGTARLILG